MNPRNPIQDELNSLNSPIPATAATPFSVPEGYFEGLAEAILARIRTEGMSAADETAALSPLLAGIPRTLPYSVPQGYFDENLEILPLMIGAEETSPLLASIGKENPYSVPAGYFETLQAPAAAAPAQPKMRVVRMHKWMRVAAAAVVTGAIALGGLLYFGKDAAVPEQTGAPVASELRKELKQVSTEELDEFLQSTAVLPEEKTEQPAQEKINTSTASAKPTDVKKMLKDVSDEELEQFLDELPADDDEMMLN
jgi:hypothetical protein